MSWQPSDKVDLNTKFHSLDNHITENYEGEVYNKWIDYLYETDYMDDAYKKEWSEIWLEDTIVFGEKLIGRLNHE